MGLFDAFKKNLAKEVAAVYRLLCERSCRPGFPRENSTDFQTTRLAEIDESPIRPILLSIMHTGNDSEEKLRHLKASLDALALGSTCLIKAAHRGRKVRSMEVPCD
jgi:hypothetical protein